MRENRTGDLVEIDAPGLTWLEWRDNRVTTSNVSLDSDLLELDRVGLWKTEDGAQGTSYLLSGVESDVPGFGSGVSSSTAESDRPEVSRARSFFPGDVTWLIIAVIVLLLVIENWLFHRHAVY